MLPTRVLGDAANEQIQSPPRIRISNDLWIKANKSPYIEQTILIILYETNVVDHFRFSKTLN